MKKPLLILKAGSTFPEVIRYYGDFEDWFRAKINPPREDLVAEVFMEEVAWPDYHDFAGTVVTGSHDNVTDHTPWIEKLTSWLTEAMSDDHPILGVCFGHQVLAYAAGGHVGGHPVGQELGTVKITLTEEGRDDPLFQGLPPVFPVHLNHAQTVLTPPPEARLLAYNDFEATQAFRIRNAVGVQFHPEYTEEIMRAQIMEQKEQIEKNGKSVKNLLEQITPPDYGRIVINNFVDSLGDQRVGFI